jgi:hypothetical protein
MPSLIIELDAPKLTDTFKAATASVVQKYLLRFFSSSQSRHKAKEYKIVSKIIFFHISKFLFVLLVRCISETKLR